MRPFSLERLEDRQMLTALATAADALSDPPTIIIGHHLLMPGTPNQAIPVYVSGGQQVEGLDFFLQIADGGPQAGGTVVGPAIQSIDIISGTIFDGNNNGQTTPPGDVFDQVEVGITTTASGDVAANGLLGTVVIDTTGFPSGTWEMRMAGTIVGNSTFAGTEPQISAGSITIVASTAAADGIGVFEGGYWLLDYSRNASFDPGDGGPHTLGWQGATPVVGDWDGNGVDELGLYAGGVWFLDTNANGQWDGAGTDALFYYGWDGALPVVGDWNGDGTDDVGVYNVGVWFRDLNGNRLWDGPDSSALAYFGWDTATPVPGDFNGDGTDEVGVYNLGAWFRDVNGSNTWDAADQASFIYYGWDGPLPVAGDWNGDGTDDVGVYNVGAWFRDVNANNAWDATDAALVAHFGSTAMLPVVGDWPAATYHDAILAEAGAHASPSEPNSPQPINWLFDVEQPAGQRSEDHDEEARDRVLARTIHPRA